MSKIVRMSQYGWKPDHSDQRDYAFSAPRLRLPKSVDLRAGCSPVKNQGELGSCTGHAIGAYLEYLYPSRPNFSRLFIYYNERVMEGTVAEDAGAQIRNGVKSVQKIGACRETLCPYDISKFTKKPTFGAYENAKKGKITSYSRVGSLNALRSALADGKPVVFGFIVYESFESEEVANTGILPMPEDHETAYGGHAVLAVGYDDKTKRVLVRNSWGRYWGQKGYFTMPYDYIANKDLCDDFWVLNK